MTLRLRLLAPFLAVVVTALAVLATAASAATASGEESASEPMSVEFPHRHASLAGPRALVSVRCNGIVAEMCEGTLVLSGVGGSHKVPYAIERGESQTLAVPLGDQPVDHGCRARVVARTLQLTGGLVRTSRVMRLG